MKLAFTVQYIGARYKGYQIQKEDNTIQQELEKAFSIVLRHGVSIYAAGRTDSGVNAIGQVIHLETKNEDAAKNKMDEECEFLNRLIYSINCILPSDISIIYGKRVSDEFHARFSCLRREYIYQILNSKFRHSLLKDFLWVREKLNLELINKAIPYLMGEKDYASFTKTSYQKLGKSTKRRIDRIQIVDHSPKIYFHYEGSGFLHNMVRILTGTLLEVAQRKIKPEKVQSILNGQNRRLTGKTLPSHPLYFLNAIYADYKTPKELLMKIG